MCSYDFKYKLIIFKTFIIKQYEKNCIPNYIFFSVAFLPFCRPQNFDDAPGFFVVVNKTEYPLLVEINAVQASHYLPSRSCIVKPRSSYKINNSNEGNVHFFEQNYQMHFNDTLSEYSNVTNKLIEKVIHSIAVYQTKDGKSTRANCDFALFKYWQYVPDEAKYEHRLELHIAQEHFN